LKIKVKKCLISDDSLFFPNTVSFFGKRKVFLGKVQWGGHRVYPRLKKSEDY
jgi:hypothetical protein